MGTLDKSEQKASKKDKRLRDVGTSPSSD